MTVIVDRMELADIGNPKKLADHIISSNPSIKVPIPVEEIAYAAGITEIVRKYDLKFEGALVSDDTKERGIIVCNSSSVPERQRFTIAHELGHFLIQTHSNNMECISKSVSFNVDGKFINKEQEANVFASNLLLPPSLVSSELNKIKYKDLEKIEDVRKMFLVSTEAFVRSCVNLFGEPISFIFSENGIVKSYTKSDDFPYIGVHPKTIMPVKLHSNDNYEITETLERDGDFWLSNRPNLTVYEQHLILNNKYAITMLTLD